MMGIEIIPFKTGVLSPPQDDLLSKISETELSLEEGDVVALASKVVSIWQGRCIPKKDADKDSLARTEAEYFMERAHTPGASVMHTITEGVLIPSAGIDPFGDYYVLWPENPNNAAEVLLAWFKKKYARENLAVVITDSRSQPLRQGVTGFAIGWAGFSPLHDGRNRKDLLGAFSGGSQVNVADSIAAAAVLVMGEANEQTPIVRLRGVPYVTDPHLAQSKNFARDNDLGVDMEKDIFAPFLRSVPWKEGWKKKRVR